MSWHSLIEAIAYGGIAAVLSVTGRAFGTLNLAAGTWVTIGGWAGFAIVRGLAGADVSSVRPVGFILLLPMALSQFVTPSVLGRNTVERPLAVLLVTLGIHRAGDAISTRWLVTSSQSRIPEDLFPLWLAVVGIMGVVGFAVWLKNTQWFNAIAFQSRASLTGEPVWLSVGLVYAVETMLLFVLGAFAGAVLRGIVGNEFLTVVPVLAISAARFDTGKSFVVALIAVLAMRGAEASVPMLGRSSSTVVLLGLAAIVVWRQWPRRPVVRARPVEALLAPWPKTDKTGLPALVASFRQPFTAFVFLAALLAALVAIDGPDEFALVRGAYMLALTVAAARTARLLGVQTIGWPLLAAVGAVLLTTPDSPTLLVTGLLAMAAVWAGYCLLLRVIPAASAIVVDLALIVATVQLSTSWRLFGGNDGARELSIIGDPWSTTILGLVLTTLIGVLWIGVPWLARTRQRRASVLGVASFPNGQIHGLQPTSILLGIGATFALCVALVGAAWVAASGILTDRDITISTGLFVLLMASMLNWLPFLVAASTVLLITGFVERYMAGSGVMLDVVIGLLLVTFVWSTNRQPTAH